MSKLINTKVVTSLTMTSFRLQHSAIKHLQTVCCWPSYLLAPCVNIA